MCGIDLTGIPNSDFLNYADLERFEAPIKACLNAVGPAKILYLVLSTGLPYFLGYAPSGAGTAIDAYLNTIWKPATGYRFGNPYFVNDNASTNSYAPFVSLASFREKNPSQQLYSVFRIDGTNVQEAKALVDRALEAEAHGLDGNACMDRRYGSISTVSYSSYGVGDWWVYRTGQLASAAGFPVIDDANGAEFGTAPAAPRCDNAALYAGWYSYGNYNDVFTYAPGAIVTHYDSLSNGGFTRNVQTWGPMALHRGAAVVTGAIGEPYLTGVARSDSYLNMLVNFGANVGDALFRATPHLQWMVVNIGDPLYVPFPRRSAAPATAPSKLVISGAVQIPADLCAGFSVIAKDSNNYAIPLRQATAVAISGQGSAGIFSDAACAQPLAGAVIPADASSARFFIKAGAAPQTLNLIASASGLASGSRSVEVHRPVSLGGYFPALTVGACASFSLKTVDAFGYRETSINGVEVQLSTTGSAGLFSDSACTVPVTQAVIPAGKSQIQLYAQDPVVETFTFRAVDSAGRLAPYQVNVNSR